MEQAPERQKVFLSYRSTDRAMVEQFAERLRRDGIDAWYDHWEITPGNDIVAKMDQGIDGCAAGLIFVSGTGAAVLGRRGGGKMGVVSVRDADCTVMLLSSCLRMVLGATDRNCRWLP